MQKHLIKFKAKTKVEAATTHNEIKITAITSAIPDSSNSSREAWLALTKDILLKSLFKLVRSDLYSLNLARSMALTLGCRLLASRSIFRIWKRKKNTSKKLSSIKFETKPNPYQHITIIQPRFDLGDLFALLLWNSGEFELKFITEMRKEILMVLTKKSTSIRKKRSRVAFTGEICRELAVLALVSFKNVTHICWDWW